MLKFKNRRESLEGLRKPTTTTSTTVKIIERQTIDISDDDFKEWNNKYSYNNNEQDNNVKAMLEKIIELIISSTT